eukprot:scaffold51643_cov20-Tisochrysis_lutea.AAC.1
MRVQLPDSSAGCQIEPQAEEKYKQAWKEGAGCQIKPQEKNTSSYQKERSSKKHCLLAARMMMAAKAEATLW